MRLGLLSNENLTPWINWSTLGPPLLAGLAAHGGEVIAPPPLSFSNRSAWRRIVSKVSRADALFWIQPSARPELAIHLASFAKIGGRRSAFVYDAFEPLLNRIGILAVAQRLDPCFVAYREAADELARRFPVGRFEWMPFGADTGVFAPSDPDRPIFAFWMGRRHEPLHEALRSYCDCRGLTYVYRTGDQYPSAAELGRIAGSSKYFVVTPPDLDNPIKTGRFSPLVMRYLEGLAAGARLLGALPKSGEYEALLPLDAICQVDPEGRDLARRLEEDLASPVAWEAVKRAQQLVASRHSWSARAEQIYRRLLLGRDPVSPDNGAT